MFEEIKTDYTRSIEAKEEFRLEVKRILMEVLNTITVGDVNYFTIVSDYRESMAASLHPEASENFSRIFDNIRAVGGEAIYLLAEVERSAISIKERRLSEYFDPLIEFKRAFDEFQSSYRNNSGRIIIKNSGAEKLVHLIR